MGRRGFSLRQNRLRRAPTARGPGKALNRANAKVGGMIVLGDAMVPINRKAIIALAAYQRLPVVYASRDFVEDGGLIAYGVCIPCSFYSSAAFIDRIIKGPKAGDLPVELPTRLHLVISLRTAKSLDLNISSSLLARATEVIEQAAHVACWQKADMPSGLTNVCS